MTPPVGLGIHLLRHLQPPPSGTEYNLHNFLCDYNREYIEITTRSCASCTPSLAGVLALTVLVVVQTCFAALPVTGDCPMAVAETSHGLLLSNGSGSGLWLHDGEGTAS